MQDKFESFQKMGIYIWNTSINCVLILLTSLFPADFANIGMPCCCHGNERSLYGLGCDSEKNLYRNGTTIRTKDIECFCATS